MWSKSELLSEPANEKITFLTVGGLPAAAEPSLRYHSSYHFLRYFSKIKEISEKIEFYHPGGLGRPRSDLIRVPR